MIPTDSTNKVEELRAYHAYLDKMEEQFEQDPEQDDWKVHKVLSHKVRHMGEDKQLLLKVQWLNGEKSLMPADTVRLHDPWAVCVYGFSNNLTTKPGWEWVDTYLEQDETLAQMVNTYKVSKRDDGAKFKFGVEVPRNPKHALELDQKGWQHSINLELKQLDEFKTFKLIPPGQPTPRGYKRIPYHFVFDIKFDGRLKSRLVAGGHRTPDVPKEDVFSPVVGMEAIRLGFTLARLNGLEVCAGDIGNAYLNATTREKVFIVAGPEFGPELVGQRLMVDKSLYGLKTSAARFHEHLSVKLRKLGYKPSKADADLWVRQDPKGHYEYIARYVDDVISFSKDPLGLMHDLENTYTMKGIGSPSII